jgi:hypothetical protein
MKSFSLKFLDVMIGVILGLGFQWWPNLHETWQFAAFIFVYLDIVDYWIDYSPSLKKFPPKMEVDVFLDISIMFVLFLYIYSTQLSIITFFISFFALKVLDYLWLLSSRHEYKPEGNDGLFVNTWLHINVIEGIFTAGFIAWIYFLSPTPLYVLISFIVLRILTRALASLRYKRIHFA